MALTALQAGCGRSSAVWRVAPVIESTPWGKRARIKFA